VGAVRGLSRIETEFGAVRALGADPSNVLGYTRHLNLTTPTLQPVPMNAITTLIDTVITVYIYLLIASAILSWLMAYKVVNVQNKVVYTLVSFLYRVTEPPLRPIRRIVPNLGGIDISPIILILLLYFVRDLIFDNLL
jgi:YggT family protein